MTASNWSTKPYWIPQDPSLDQDGIRFRKDPGVLHVIHANQWTLIDITDEQLPHYIAALQAALEHANTNPKK